MSMKRDIMEMKREMEILKSGKGKQSRKVGFKKTRKMKKILKASKKKKNANKILFIYYRMNGRMEGPNLVPYSDNVLVYRHKAYEVDPRAIWDWGKYKVYSWKESDRRPISNLDLKEIKKRGDLTDSDEILIKAVMRAIAGGASKKMNMKALIVVIAIVVIVAGFFLAR